MNAATADMLLKAKDVLGDEIPMPRVTSRQMNRCNVPADSTVLPRTTKGLNFFPLLTLACRNCVRGLEDTLHKPTRSVFCCRHHVSTALFQTLRRV